LTFLEVGIWEAALLDCERITGKPEATEFDALSKIYAEKPDLEAGERFLRQSVRLDPRGFFVDIELGNLYLKRGSRENALQAYSDVATRSQRSGTPALD